MVEPKPSLESARELDRSDPLREFRDQFHMPQTGEEDEVYFVGNSLGLQPKRTQQYLDEELEQWRRLGVRGHFEGEHPWLPYHEFLTETMSQIVGGSPREVVVMNSLTVNLHLMMATFYRPTAERNKILIEEHAFPSDHYAVTSQIKLHGFDPEQSLVCIAPDEGSELVSTERVIETIEANADTLALVLLPGVQYYTGQFWDLKAITAAAKKHAINVGFDLAHAAGNVAMSLHDWDVDFACWCTYKYLNSGPGSVAGCFVHERHAKNVSLERMAGWWGHDKESRFRMENKFAAIPTAEGWQLSNPPILSLAAIRASLDVFSDAGGMEPLCEKSKRMTGFFEAAIRAELGNAVEIITPADPEARGCQLSLKMKSGAGRSVHEKLEATGVRTDWREPNVIRAAPVPLYNSFEDVWSFVSRLKEIL